MAHEREELRLEAEMKHREFELVGMTKWGHTEQERQVRMMGMEKDSTERLREAEERRAAETQVRERYPRQAHSHSLPSSTRLEGRHFPVAISPTYPSRGRPHSLPSSTRLGGRHFPVDILPTENKKEPYKCCVVCYSHNKRKDTKYKCDTCGIPLCAAPCLKDYHVDKNH